MAFRYINPGYVKLLSGGGMTTTESFVYNPENGVAFCSGSSGNAVSLVEIFPAGYVSNDLYCKFDLYVEGNPYYGDKFYMGLARYDDQNSISWITGISTYDGYAYIFNTSRKICTSQKLKDNALNSISFSLNLQEATASLTLNNETINCSGLSYTKYYGTMSPFKIQLPKDGNCTYYIANLIVSDVEISPKETIIALPVRETITDMTAGASGIYIADAANQTLLQTVDVSTLIENYGASSAVTGIALVGNPAYKTAAGLTSLIGLSKRGASTVEHGICDLSSDTTAAISDAWSTENMTIADLQGAQFGWKVGT